MRGCPGWVSTTLKLHEDASPTKGMRSVRQNAETRCRVAAPFSHSFDAPAPVPENLLLSCVATGNPVPHGREQEYARASTRRCLCKTRISLDPVKPTIGLPLADEQPNRQRRDQRVICRSIETAGVVSMSSAFGHTHNPARVHFHRR